MGAGGIFYTNHPNTAAIISPYSPMDSQNRLQRVSQCLDVSLHRRTQCKVIGRQPMKDVEPRKVAALLCLHVLNLCRARSRFCAELRYSVASDCVPNHLRQRIERAAYSEDECLRLGYRIRRQRENRSSLTKEQVQKLDAIGMIRNLHTYRDIRYVKVKVYYGTHHTSSYYVAPFADRNEEKLYEWPRQQCRRRKNEKPNRKQIRALDAIGMN